MATARQKKHEARLPKIRQNFVGGLQERGFEVPPIAAAHSQAGIAFSVRCESGCISISTLQTKCDPIASLDGLHIDALCFQIRYLHLAR